MEFKTPCCCAITHFEEVQSNVFQAVCPSCGNSYGANGALLERVGPEQTTESEDAKPEGRGRGKKNAND